MLVANNRTDILFYLGAATVDRGAAVATASAVIRDEIPVATAVDTPATGRGAGIQCFWDTRNITCTAAYGPDRGGLVAAGTVAR